MSVKAPEKPAKAKKKATPKPVTFEGTRLLRPPRFWAYRFSKKIQYPKKLPNSFKLTKRAFVLLWRHKRLMLWFVVSYGVLNIVFVRGFSGGTDVSSLKDTFDQLLTGNWGHVVSGLAIFALLLSSSGNSSSAQAGAYQMFLLLVFSLALVWAFRQVLAGTHIRLRDAFYKGMAPLVPVLLVLAVVFLQLVPLLLGGALFDTLIGGDIAVHPWEKTVSGLAFFLLAVWSLYMVSSSLFGLYIATLPDMTPMKALRSARQLVRFRRFSVLRKVIFLPVMLLIVSAVIMIPVIVFAPMAAQWVFYVLTMLWLVMAHVYMYTLYRELLV